MTANHSEVTQILVCAGKLTVQQAQDMFRTDWIGHCAAFMGRR